MGERPADEGRRGECCLLKYIMSTVLVLQRSRQESRTEALCYLNKKEAKEEIKVALLHPLSIFNDSCSHFFPPTYHRMRLKYMVVNQVTCSIICNMSFYK